VDGLIKLRMQRVFIGALCRQMSSCNQSERDAIFGRDSYERKLGNHHNEGRRQEATAIIEFFSVTHTSKNFEGSGAPVFVEGGRLCHGTMAQWPVQACWRTGWSASSAHPRLADVSRGRPRVSQCSGSICQPSFGWWLSFGYRTSFLWWAPLGAE